MSSPSGAPATITVIYDDDADGAATALLAVLHRPNPNPEQDEEHAPDEDTAA